MINQKFRHVVRMAALGGVILLSGACQTPGAVTVQEDFRRAVNKVLPAIVKIDVRPAPASHSLITFLTTLMDRNRIGLISRKVWGPVLWCGGMGRWYMLSPMPMSLPMPRTLR